MILPLIVSFVVLFCFYNFYWKRRNLPPGPFPLPFVGNIWHLGREPPGESVFRKWKDTYGSIYTYWLGEMPVVSVNDYSLIKEVFVENDGCNGRPHVGFGELIGSYNKGVGFTDGEEWIRNRRLILQTLRDFGMGKNLVEEKIHVEISAIFSQMDSALENGENIQDILRLTDMAVASIICSFMFGYRFDSEHLEQFNSVKSATLEMGRQFGSPYLNLSLGSFRFIRNLPFVRTKIGEIRKVAKVLLDFMKERIKEHKSSEDFLPSDFVGTVLLERQKSAEAAKFFDDEQLIALCMDMWIAGQETTTKTIGWGLGYLLHHPDIQKRCQSEIDAVVGSDRLVTVMDRPNLPYCQAVIHEIQRKANLLPQSLLHRTTKPISVNGFNIPSNVAIVPQLSVLLNDEKVFPEPEKFNPDRFLEPSGKLKKTDELLAFSTGKRVCLGEGLARMELFLIITNILNRYSLRANGKPPSMERKMGGTVGILPFHCDVERRSAKAA